MRLGKYKPSQIRKAIVAACGAVGILGTQAVSTFTQWLSVESAATATSIIGLITTLGVYLVRNAPLIDSADDL